MLQWQALLSLSTWGHCVWHSVMNKRPHVLRLFVQWKIRNQLQLGVRWYCASQWQAWTTNTVIRTSYVSFSLAVGGPSTTTRLNVAITSSAEHRYTPPSSTPGISIRSTFPSGVLGRGRPSSRDHVTIKFWDVLHTSTTVCPAVMLEGPSICTAGAMREGREGRKLIICNQ